MKEKLSTKSHLALAITRKLAVTVLALSTISYFPSARVQATVSEQTAARKSTPGYGAASHELVSEDRQWILREWENVLNDLERDVTLTRDRVDWMAKKFLLNALQEEEKLSWSDPWLQSIDLEYHNVDLERGLFYELVRQGSVRRVVSEDEIKMSIFNPPETTRAFFRGRSVAKFNDWIASLQWDEIVFGQGAQSRRIALPEATLDARLEALNHAARNGKDFGEFIRAVGAID